VRYRKSSDRDVRIRLREHRERVAAYTLRVSVGSHRHLGPCVYVLLLDGAPVYVGKSRVGFRQRWDKHRINKRFDTIIVIDVSPDPGEDDLLALEQAVGERLRPGAQSFHAYRVLVDEWAEHSIVPTLDAEIAAACERSPEPRYTPPPEVDLRDVVARIVDKIQGTGE